MKQLWLAVAIMLGLGLFGLSANPSAAQDNESLRNQIDQLRQQVRQLTAQVNDLSRGGGAPASSGAIGAGGDNPGTMARLDEISESMRRLNGRIEELEFKVDNLARGVDTVKRDVDLKLAAPATPATTGVAPSAAPSAARSTVAGAESGAAATTTAPAPTQTGAPDSSYNPNEAPRTLGSMPLDPGAGEKPAETPVIEKPRPEKPVEKPPAVEAPAAETAVAAVTQASPKEQYDAAHRLLKNAQYGEAEGAFRGFIDANPKDPNVEKASYWLGETYYVRKQFDQAYQVYARNLQKWPKGEKAPDNLVKLSLSLVSLKRDAEACQFLAVLDSDYPKAAANVKQAGERAKKQAKCK